LIGTGRKLKKLKLGTTYPIASGPSSETGLTIHSNERQIITNTSPSPVPLGFCSKKDATGFTEGDGGEPIKKSNVIS
jgi:hypothetical protein